jgi:type I restriction enzyme, S subunit
MDEAIQVLDLPEGWTWCSLHEIVGADGMFKDGDWIETKDQDPNGEVRLIQLADIGEGIFKNRSSRYLTMEKARALGCTFLKPGDILIARLPDPLGRACIFPGDRKPAITAVDVSIVRTGTDGPHTLWLMHALNSPNARMQIEEFQRGTTRGRISRRNLGKISITKPPLTDQKRIVAKLEELLPKVNAVRERLIRVKEIMKRFRQSVLSAACSGRLTSEWRERAKIVESADELLKKILSAKSGIQKGDTSLRRAKPRKETNEEPNPEFEGEAPDTWAIASMDMLTSLVTSGSRAWKKFYSDDGPGTFIMGQNVKPFRLEFPRKIRVNPPDGDPERRRSKVMEGDLLVTIAGNTGDVCRVSEPLEDHYVCQSVALLRPVFQSIAPFLELYLNSPFHGQSQFRGSVYGEGRPHLSFDHLKALCVLLPPMQEQSEIVRRVASLFSLAARIEKRIEAELSRTEKIPQAILAKAFRGELMTAEAELA